MTETDTTPHVLFLRKHNAARSQMAEAFLRHFAGDRFEVLSAGLVPTQVHPLIRQVLTETGLDPSRLRAKGLNDVHGWDSHTGRRIMICHGRATTMLDLPNPLAHHACSVLRLLISPWLF